MSLISRVLLSRTSFPVRFPSISCSNFSSTSSRWDKPAVTPESEAAKSENPSHVLQALKYHTVDGIDRRILVWAGKYKKTEDVPAKVSMETLQSARNKVRIRTYTYIMIVGMVASIAFAYSGKQAAKRGETVQKMNLDWHKEFNKNEPAAK